MDLRNRSKMEDRKLKEYHKIVLPTKNIGETISKKMSGTCNMHIKCWPKQLNGRDFVGDQITNGATLLQRILISRVQTESV